METDMECTHSRLLHPPLDIRLVNDINHLSSKPYKYRDRNIQTEGGVVEGSRRGNIPSNFN